MKDKSQPAFPANCEAFEDYPDYCANGMAGLSVRDYFAGQALIGALSGELHRFNNQADAQALAEIAYLIADNFVLEREK